ncbi:MAG: hypothetical protein DHS20C15_24670 [Planctomycetota bacterium]|nr:MAG: hypothetical protein DHS20C15_24670 [Planctomycetota bacterium]
MNAPTPRVPKATPAQLAKAGKERKQLFVLGGLALAFVAVLVIQFGGSSGKGQSTPDDEPLAAASTPGASAPAPTLSGTQVEDNSALSESSEAEAVSRSPFAAFWKSGDTPEDEVSTDEPELPPPAIRLDGTLTSGDNPKAFIDGQLRSLGDIVGGWTLVGVASREVTLRSPTKRVVTVTMPKVPGMQ